MFLVPGSLESARCLFWVAHFNNEDVAMSNGSVNRQEREFLSCVIRQLPGLNSDTRQFWIDCQDRLAKALESALQYDHKRTSWDRLREAISRVTKGKGSAEVVLLIALRDSDQWVLDKVARSITQIVAPHLLED